MVETISNFGFFSQSPLPIAEVPMCLNMKHYRFFTDGEGRLGVIYCYQSSDLNRPRRRRGTGERRGRPRIHRRIDQTSAFQRAKNDRVIKPSQFRNATEAFRYAGTVNLRLTVFLTIRWFDTKQTEFNIQERYQTLMRSLKNLFLRHDGDLAYIAVHENPYGGKHKPAFNTHIFLNVPRRIPLSAWLSKLNEHVHLAIGATSDQAVDVRSGDVKVLNYMLKGCTYSDARRAGMFSAGRGWKHNQGAIHFQRISISQNINFAARQNVNKRYA